MIHENIELTGSLEISGSFVIPLGDAADRESSPSTGSLFYNTASRALETYNGNTWVTQSGGSGGSGGGGNAGTFTASPLNYLIVAGGGGGGSRYYGGGGGGGGFRSSSIASTNSSIASGSTFTITVGAGGAASPSSGDGGNGGNSSIAATGLTTITSTGGGGGGGSITGGSGNGDGNDGGSGGGARAWSGTHQHGYGTTGQGHRAGVTNTTHTDLGYTFSNSQYNPGNAWGSGGGGAGQVGYNGHYQSTNNPTYPGAGGDGSGSAITGTNTTYAGGGGGGWNANNDSTVPYSSTNGVAPGGAGGGGNGGKGFTSPYSTATAGTTNLGGGGGAGSHSGATNGAAGGSGIVIVSYDSGSMGGAGGIKGDDGNGNRYHVFNSSDSFILGNNNDFDVVTDGLAAHYDAGDYASRGTSTWTDLAGSYNGTVSGATLGANWYYDFDGSNDSVTITSTATTPIDTTDSFSIEIWVRHDDLTSHQTYVSKWGTTNGTRAYIFRLDDTTNRVAFVESTGGSNFNTRLSTTALTATTWAHLVVTSTSAAVNFYLNGSADGSITRTQTRESAGTQETRLAYRSSNAHPLDGRLAQVRLYSKALSASEVLQNYNATKQNFV